MTDNVQRAVNNATTWLLLVWASDLTATQKLICCYLRSYMNDYRETAWPSKPTIGGHCGITTRAVQLNLITICQRGFLEVKGYSDLGTIRYAICTPELGSPPRTKQPLPPELGSPKLNNITLCNIFLFLYSYNVSNILKFKLKLYFFYSFNTGLNVRLWME